MPLNEELKYVCLVVACAQILKRENRNSLIQRNVCLKQLFDNYQLAGNRKATLFVTVSGLSMNKPNFYSKKTDSFAKCNDDFPLHVFYLNAHPIWARISKIFCLFVLKKSMKL